MRLRKFGEAAERAAERRRREDDAPRLIEQVPTLESLRLEIHESRGGAAVPEGKHLRRIVVESAPALFLLQCGDRACKDGGHDVTREIMRQLISGATQFEGDDACNGSIGSSSCTRVLTYVGFATYRSAAAVSPR